MKRTIAILAAALIAVWAVADKTTRRGLQVELPEPTEQLDTIATPDPAAVVVSGYDKPPRASRETFFVTNNLPDTLVNIKLRVEYSDLRGRRLHSREESVTCMLPPGDTRNYSIATWDVQRSFTYRLSSRSPRSRAIPYDVSITVISACTKPTIR